MTTGSVSFRARAVATSTTHSSSPVGRSSTKARDFASGEKRGAVNRASAGRATTRAGPPSTACRLSPVSQDTRLSAMPLLRGLIRVPASRSIGSASALMLGRLDRSSSTRILRSGLSIGDGVGLASRMSAIGDGGC